jgi:transcriptional regulator with XRE-family HTH domain
MTDTMVHFSFNVSEPKKIRWLDNHFPEPRQQKVYAEEACIVAASEAVAVAIEQSGLTRSEVAERIGASKQHVTNALSGRNLTLRTLADLLWACGLEVRGLELAELGVTHATTWEPVQAEPQVIARGTINVGAATALPETSPQPAATTPVSQAMLRLVA